MQETMLAQMCSLIAPLLRSKCPTCDIAALLSYIQTLPMKLRKQLITLCRGMSIPHHGTSLYHKTSDLLLSIPKNIEPVVFSLACDPLTTGLLISLAISLPIPENIVRGVYTELLAKEMTVMESTPLPPAINYNCFFGEYTTPIHPTISANPRQAHAIHSIIDKWILATEDTLILPHMTNKLCSKATQNMVRSRYPEYLTFEEDGATQPDLEYLYMTKGDHFLGSPCEVKQRWYTSGLVPRTYYAAGADAYHRSKYVRVMLNALCDYLPPTERFSRVNPHRIVLKNPSAHALIYDLSSFTSNMHEQRHFIYRLAMYCKGRFVRILDAVEGVVSIDIGDLLLQYNTLNEEPSYMSEKLLGVDVELTHHVAGFLGVYGNLATCTFLHGAIMSQLVDDFSQLGVAGDDGLIDSSDDWTTFFVIRLLGLMEESKVYNTSEEGWQVYLKRPTRQFHNRIYSESFAIYSMVEHLFDCDDSRFFPVQRKPYERLGALASSLVVYLKTLSRLTLSTIECEVVHTFLVGIYTKVGFPTEGCVPQVYTPPSLFSAKIPPVLIPTLRVDFIGKDPIEMTIRSLYDGIAVLPEIDEDHLTLDVGMLYVGSSFEAVGTQYLSYLRKLGFLELEPLECVYTGEDGFLRLLKFYSPGRLRRKYTVTVLAEIPCNLLLML